MTDLIDQNENLLTNQEKTTAILFRSDKKVTQNLDHNPDFGRRVSCTLKKDGDVLKSIFLRVKLPKLDKYHRWVQNVGQVLCDRVDIFIGDKKISETNAISQYSWNKLTLSQSMFDQYKNMIGQSPNIHSNICKVTEAGLFTDKNVEWNETEEIVVYIPIELPFEIPVLSLGFEDVRLEITFAEIGKLIEQHSALDQATFFDCINHKDLTIQEAFLVTNYEYFLDNEKRRKIAQCPQKLVNKAFTGCQFEICNYKPSMEYKLKVLDYNNPIDEIMMLIQRKPFPNFSYPRMSVDDEKSSMNPLEGENLLKTARLSFNGNFTEAFDGIFWSSVQQYENKRNNCPGIYLFKFREPVVLEQDDGELEIIFSLEDDKLVEDEEFLITFCFRTKQEYVATGGKLKNEEGDI
jgi:hypothetical protein